MRKWIPIGSFFLALTIFLSLVACGPAPEKETEPAPEVSALPILSEEAEPLYSTVLSFELGELLDLCPAGDGWLLSTEEGIYTLDADHALLPEEEPISAYAKAMTEDSGDPLWLSYAEEGSGYVLRDRERERYAVDPGHGYPNIQLLAADGSVWICDYYRLLRDGAELELPREPGCLWRGASLVKTPEGLFAVLVHTEEASHNNLSARLVPVSADTAALRETEGRELPEALRNVEPVCAPESGCLYADGKLWRLEDEGIRLLADLQTYGLNPSALRRILLDGDRILCLETDGLLILNSEPPDAPSEGDPSASSEPPAERATLRLGVLRFEPEDLTLLVSYINRSATCCRLETKLYEDVEQLNRAVLSGDVDLISLYDLSTLENYTKAGLLQPIDELLPELFASDILYQNMVEGLRQQGHCYYLPPAFTCRAMYLPKAYGTDPESLNTLRVLTALLEEREPQSFGFSTKRSTLAAYWLPETIDYWVNTEAGTARFDTPEFVEFLDFCDRYCMTWDEVSANRAGLTETDYDMPRFKIGLNLDPNYMIKYELYRPPYEGLSTVSVYSESYLAAVHTADSGEVRAFFETVLTDEGWHDKVTQTSNFSDNHLFLNQTWTERDQVQIEQKTLDAYTGTYNFDAEDYKASMDKYRSCIKEANRFQGSDSELIEIITEEAIAFFNGDITTEEAARRIQNRVEIYLAEHG